MTVIRRAGLDPNAAFLPNAIALVRSHLAKHIDAAARLVPNRLACMDSVAGEMTPAEIWSLAESYVNAQTWSNKDDVFEKLRKHLRVRVGGEMVLVVEANERIVGGE